ncbi:MAG: hypothetical protein M3440_05075, partial [Chloroflexota bacterium]|nr:hypothetical protein [Chloroflexota bacterium]
MSRTLTKRVTIDGVSTEVDSISTDHDVDRPVATGSLTMTAPRPSHVDLAASVKIEAGWDGAVQTIFDGRIVDDDTAFSHSGGTLKVALEGWAKLLWYAQPADVTYGGPAMLNALYNAFCYARGVPYFASDNSLNPDGTTLVFGGVPEVNGGNVTFKRNATPGADLARMGRHYGYRIFDTPTGVVQLQKVSGLPGGDPVRAYEQGVNLLDVRRIRTLAGMFNYNEIFGAKYTLADTSEYAVRSFPSPLPGDTRLGPSGVSHRQITDADILTNARADAARNVYEVDGSSPQFRYAWSGTGDAGLIPGHVVSVMSPMLHGDGGTDLISFLVSIAAIPMWLMHVGHRISGSGWTTAMEGWLGAGTTFPAGNDCVTTTILGSEGRHVGNEYLWHYRRPNPDGLTVSIPFTVAADYSTLTIRYDGHGANSFVRNQQSTASRFEIWQTIDGVYKSVASGEMSRQDENLERRDPYGETVGGVYTNRYWTPSVIPLSGSLKAGAADLKIISGKDSTVGDNDDLEVANCILVTCGSQ